MNPAVDGRRLLEALAVDRPVFHSEADFQHSFAWLLREMNPDLRVRLEARPSRGVHLDVFAYDSSTQMSLAVELKYLTASWEGVVGGEHFSLLNHGAQDIRGYDCVKDIGRRERIVGATAGVDGLAVVLTNEPGYWQAPNHGRVTNASQFRLHEGTLLEGRRAWGPVTGPGTMKMREESIELAGTYTCKWVDYSDLAGRKGRFRVLVHHVPAHQRRDIGLSPTER